MRLDKALAHMGYGSRKEVKRLIRQGVVRVNDMIIRDDDHHFDLDQDDVMIFDESVDVITKQYILYHKKKDTLCSHIGHVYPTVYEQIPFTLLPQVHTVGRLDVDTEGVLVLSNDGHLSHRLLSPKHHVEKVYEVHLEKPFDVRFIELIEKGIKLESDELCLPAKIRIIKDKMVELTLTEGKYHQVKRMMHACDNDVTKLIRTRFGPITLKGLELGACRLLDEAEIEMLKQI
jgi:16S rRNA pseudouridine516 synthase